MYFEQYHVLNKDNKKSILQKSKKYFTNRYCTQPILMSTKLLNSKSVCIMPKKWFCV